MLNTIGDKKKFVTDVRAERLFREAEDDFFYFNKIEAAITKIEKALEYTPNMLKAIIMRANIAFLEGNFEQALDFYQKAESLAPQNTKALSGLANVYEVCNNNTKSLEYINKALCILTSDSAQLKKALIDLKSTVLVKLGKYSEAKRLIDESRYAFSDDDFHDLQINNLSTINHKLELREKLKRIKLKLVK